MVISGVSPLTTTSSSVMVSACSVMVPRLPDGWAISLLSYPIMERCSVQSASGLERLNVPSASPFR